ncbi:MAG TPA: DUF6588 family protein [Bacteroidota bacterium]|nr:DUF6588 family protein [Bacteroidota bacterium]
MKAARVFVIVGIFLASVAGARAQQDLSTQLSKVANSNAVNYLSPLLSAWGADLNSGFYHSADLHDVLGFDVGVKAGAVVVKDVDKVFDFVLPNQISYTYQGVPVTLNAGSDYDNVIPGSPTAVGSSTGKTVTLKIKDSSPNILLRGKTIGTFTTPGGFDLKYAPLIMPQAAIGLPFGLEVIGRFVPNMTIGNNIAKVNFIGFGVRYSIDQYLPMVPVDIAVHFMTQKLTVSDMDDNKVLGASGTAYGIEVSKKLIFLTIYGGYQIERSTWSIDPYSYTDPFTSSTIKASGFSIDGKDKSRMHAGVRLLLLFVNLHADYSFATQPVLTAGVGVSFR